MGIPLRDPAAEREMWLARCVGPTFVLSSSPSHGVLVLVPQQGKEGRARFSGVAVCLNALNTNPWKSMGQGPRS
ncbi:hypothetical protein I7I51_00853 [Histoplasma capsulatum]|uniref:Uncharacterized protein n=1 Tax=Ajellomyces capsulatus TaxID=5037 RepID=A0A8A1MGJ8_AJECA|nr:hypothetical protein I7I51_00853 [Histoplasma capsulatum]